MNEWPVGLDHVHACLGHVCAMRFQHGIDKDVNVPTQVTTTRAHTIDEIRGLNQEMQDISFD